MGSVAPGILPAPRRGHVEEVTRSLWRNNVSPEHRGRYQEPANELNLKENPGKAGWAAGSVMRQRFLSTTITVMALAISAGVHPVLVRSAEQSDPATYLLPAADLPEGFEHQPQNDRILVEPGVVRAVRFYTRGDPEVPTEEHASILLAAAVSDSGDQAAKDFHETIRTWTALGYELSPLEGEVRDEAAAGWDTLNVGTDHPKQTALLLFRRAAVNATVQWTDNPEEVTLAHAVAIARLMELRMANASGLSLSPVR